MTKPDFGTLQLGLAAGHDDAAAKPFAQLPYPAYDEGAYVSTAGVIDIPASAVPGSGRRHRSPEPARRHPCQPADTQETQVGLREAEFTAETDDRGVYLDQPGAPWSTAQHMISVQVRYRGSKPPAGTKLRIAQYSPDPPGFGEGAWQLVSASEPQPQAPFLTMDAGGAVIDGAYTIVDVPRLEDGLPYATVEVTVSALRSGPPVLAFTPLAPAANASAPPQMVQFPELTQQFFANVRALPFHNDMAAAFENWLRTGPTVDMATQRVFDSVFRTFFIMYPAMRFIRDPLQFQAWRGPVLAATDPAIFETAAYMPVMRSVSAGQRRILELWSAYLDGSMPTQISGEALGRRG